MEKVIEGITTIFTTGGFSSASQYVVVILFFLGALGAGMIIKNVLASREKLMDDMFALFKETLKTHSDSMDSINKGVIEEIKTISESIKDGIEKMNDNTSRANDIMYDLFEKNSEKLMTVMEDEKTLSSQEFEKQTKTYFEIALLRTNNSINERIEKNNLVKLKNQLRGTETCCYLDGELASIAKKYLIDTKIDIKTLNFPYENIKVKVLSEYDRIVNTMNIELCAIFDVKENYIKEDLFGASRALIMKTINLANSISFDNL